MILAAFPGWIVKMLRRGGFGTRLSTRLGTPLGKCAAIYTTGTEFELHGAVHFHAVSVGEALLALALIRQWLKQEPERRFALATSHQVASFARGESLRRPEKTWHNEACS